MCWNFKYQMLFDKQLSIRSERLFQINIVLWNCVVNIQIIFQYSHCHIQQTAARKKGHQAHMHVSRLTMGLLFLARYKMPLAMTKCQNKQVIQIETNWLQNMLHRFSVG